MNRLKELREAHKMTQRELADRLGVTPKAISFYELGQRDIGNDTLIKLSNIFNVSVGYILGHETPAEMMRRMLVAGKPDPKKELLYALIGKIPNEKVPMAQSLLNVLLQDDYNNMA